MNTFDLVRGRFPAGEYALMAEVSDAAGYNRRRSADYIAVSTWPSRGLAVHGIEVKSHRNDWLNEKKNPAKQENHFRYCDYFWLLTTKEQVCKLEEVPDSWGWMEIRCQKIFTVKQAPKLSPVDLSKSFVVAMLKRACDKTNFVHVDSIQDRIDAAVKEKKEWAVNENDGLKKENARLKKFISDFEKASGVKLHRWDDPVKIGEAVRLITGGDGNFEKQLKTLQATAKRISENIDLVLSQTVVPSAEVYNGVPVGPIFPLTSYSDDGRATP